MSGIKLSSVMALFFAPFLAVSSGQVLAGKTDIATTQVVHKSDDFPAWWKQAVFYQVYPRSFKDTNGDGIGDIKGIIEKLDYLNNLGVDAIWINPHYDSPNTDNGYDIRDYRKIMKEYGTMEDFDRLIAEMNKRNMRLMIDIVINHTSDQHRWFVQSKSSKDNPYREYYFWRDGKNGQPPNNYPSFFGGSAWEKEDHSGQYYLHYFAKQQPDLNWDNPKVREDLYAMLRFWLDKGVAGLRFDTVATYAKIPNFPDLTSSQRQNFARTYTEGPSIHRYIKEMNRQVFSHYNIATAGEIFGVPLEKSINYFDRRRNELNIAFTFDLIRLDRNVEERWRQKAWSLVDFRQTIGKVDRAAGKYGWNAFFLDNHDNPRAVSHFGDDRPQWRQASAKALATLIITQRATPFIYQGSELGMTNYPFKTIADFDDIEVKGFWQDYVSSGRVDPEDFMRNVRLTSRDNSRTPFQWDESAHAGFTSGTPWFKVNPNYKLINASDQMKDSDSVFNYYRKLIGLRHAIPALTYGEYKDLDPYNDTVYAFTRTHGDKRYLVVINFKENKVNYRLPGQLSIRQTLSESSASQRVADNAHELLLQPWQSGIYQLN